MPAQTAHTREELIARARAVAEKLGRPRVTRTEFQALTGIPWKRPHKLFGSYTAFTREARLASSRWRERLTDDEMMRVLRDACVAAGGIVSRAHFARKAGYRPATLYRRWGSWHSVLLALRAWVAAHDPGFAFLDALPRADGSLPARRPSDGAAGRERRYGAPLNFRGVLHEPVNEAGVILLFGALAQELGFAVEHVAGSFPDCEAKRRRDDIWERVRLEFEFESRNFKVHNHDRAGCDLIVCWSHNWPECPLDVIELKTEVAKRA